MRVRAAPAVSCANVHKNTHTSIQGNFARRVNLPQARPSAKKIPLSFTGGLLLTQSCRSGDVRSYIGRISISEGAGIGFGHFLTQATASSMLGNSQIQ